MQAVAKIAPLVLNKRTVYADDMDEIIRLSGVDTQTLLRLKMIGIVDETPNFVLDVWNAGTRDLLRGGHVHLDVAVNTGRFGLSRMTLTPAGEYIVSLLETDTDLAYLRQVAEGMEKKGAMVKMVYGDVQEVDGGWNLWAKTILPWKEFEETADADVDSTSP